MLLTNATRLLTTTARRSAITKLSQRGLAVAASTQIQSASSPRYSNTNHATMNLGWIAAAAAMAGTAVAMDEKADCCGIAGVVGAKGDAR
jgi:hypothetical protein